ncbi:hypothetical protein H5410_057188 [Solanum commersonii]|uniref:Uncharacterized protein n=1 Tax=Solanum commersonii TaxID=4109 RepID=A0A9J5WQ60_SOLCO|nr:hypothetical protein H5410_057188 [Solanum commersonii]
MSFRNDLRCIQSGLEGIGSSRNHTTYMCLTRVQDTTNDSKLINLARRRSAFRSSGEFSSIEETGSDENEYIASTS